MKESEIIISTDLSETDLNDAELVTEDVDRRTFAVEIDGHGVRLDKVLAQMVAGFSRNYLQQLVEQGDVQINGHIVRKAAHKLRVGDQVAIDLRATAQSKAFLPEPMPLVVLHEDADLLVIDKPAGLVVHPAPGNWTGTLLNGLLAYAPCFSEVPRAGIVHRLDKDTSGLMVVAKHRSAMDALVAAIARRDVGRQYLAVAKGRWPAGSSVVAVTAAIGRDPGNRLRMAVVDLASQAGKAARTDITCLDRTAEAVLVHCRLHTGRTHQIRVHMASLRLPLVGDTTYGGARGLSIQRQALHATRLSFVHPTTERPVVIHSPPPTDFLQELEALGLRYNEKALPESP